MPSTSTFSILTESGVTVVAFGPDCQYITQEDVTNPDVLLEVAQTTEQPLIVIDLSHTLFFASSFIGLLIQLGRQLMLREEARFALSGLTERCEETVKRLCLDEIWEIFGSKDEAVRALSGRPS